MTPVQTARKHPELVVALLATAGAGVVVDRQPDGRDGRRSRSDLGALGWFTGSWAVMMAAMMFPSFAPSLTAYLTLTRRRQVSRWLPFACGYLLVWTAAGVFAYGEFELGKHLVASDLAWHSGGRWLSAGVIAAAAAYQFVPLKRACLTRCRGQFGGLHDVARAGWSAALATGARTGSWCLGCSWALMAALFALGVMSLTWMALIAVLVALEKPPPGHSRRGSRQRRSLLRSPWESSPRRTWCPALSCRVLRECTP